jgi:hypothetical protein
VAKNVANQIRYEIGNLISNESDLDDEELADIDQEALLNFVQQMFDSMIEETHP